MMGGGWIFWLAPLLFFCLMTRHRRRERWDWDRPAGPRERALEEQRDYLESLERRVAELEERLDFTERLLAERNRTAATPV